MANLGVKTQVQENTAPSRFNVHGNALKASKYFGETTGDIKVRTGKPMRVRKSEQFFCPRIAAMESMTETHDPFAPTQAILDMCF